MDKRTQDFYGSNAETLAAEYMRCTTGVDRYFALAFAPGGRVLDIGCGCGRDVARLQQAGFRGFGVDPCAEFLALAKKHHPESEGYDLDSLPGLRSVSDAAFDGVLCSGVLMHIPQEELFDSAFSIRRVLRQGGRLLISIPTDAQVDAATNRDPKGRLFNGVTPERFQILFERIGFHQIGRWVDSDGLGRTHRTWTTLLLVLESGDGRRSIDRVESVLNRDRKVATYKLALFRALADIAMTSYGLAIWRADGKVHVPLAEVARKWIEYYWPLCESPAFIPQIQSAKPRGKHHIAFRSLLTHLIAGFARQGGLSAYAVQLRRNGLPLNLSKMHGRLLSKVKATIKSGPVTHAGGVGTASTVFGYDKEHKALTMDGDMWRELAVMGSWIRDATILRWAELSAHFSNGRIKPSQIVDLLLVDPIPERDVADARSVYEGVPDKRCVWTDKALHARFDVDHAIPYVFWRNNDLWNLLPAASAVNNQKRDMLPARELVARRKDCIVHYWTVLRDIHRVRFEAEATRLTGTISANWKNQLFSGFAEAVEVTAVQRGVERWRPSNMVVHVDLNQGRGPAEGSHPRAMVRHDFEEVREEAYVRYLPLVGSLAAGSPFQGFETGDLNAAEQCAWIEVPPRVARKRRFVVAVAGDSMEPELRMGDLVVFEYHRTPRHDKEIVIANINEFGITSALDTNQAIKRVTQDASHWIFLSANPAYNDIRIPKNECPYPILGTMVERLGSSQR